MRVLISVATLLFGGSGCGDSSSVSEMHAPSVSDAGLEQQDAGGVLDSVLALTSDPEITGQMPAIVSSAIAAQTGLQIGYTQPDRSNSELVSLIEQRWLAIQSCVGQQAPPPLVIVQQAPLRPLTWNDAFVYDINATPMAGVASLSSSAIVQVREDDLDGSLGHPGAYLTSIMGRLLWLAAALPVRDYPYHCEQTVLSSTEP